MEASPGGLPGFSGMRRGAAKGGALPDARRHGAAIYGAQQGAETGGLREMEEFSKERDGGLLCRNI
jgi:hypothetical protein